MNSSALLIFILIFIFFQDLCFAPATLDWLRFREVIHRLFLRLASSPSKRCRFLVYLAAISILSSP